MKKLTLVIEKTKTGFSAFFKEVPVYTTGTTVQKTLTNASEAFDLYLTDSKIKAHTK